MKTNQLLCIVCLALVVLYRPCYGGDQPEIHHRLESNQPWNARRIEHDGLVLFVLVPATIRDGQIAVDVILVNRTQDDVFAGETGYFLDCRVELTTESGEKIGYSKIGHSLFSGEEWRGGQYADIMLPPGGIHRWKFNFAKAFRNLAPGTYKLSLQTTLRRSTDAKRQAHQTTLGANDIPFEVPPATALPSASKDGVTVTQNEDNVVVYGGPKAKQTAENAVRSKSPEDSIDRILENPVRLTLTNVRLAEVIEKMGRSRNIRIDVDTEALSSAGVGPDTRISIALREPVPLHTALKRILQPLGLTFVVEKDGLKVTLPQSTLNRPGSAGIGILDDRC